MKKSRIPKRLILDESIWRCGGDIDDDEIRRGAGHTELLNGVGYMCCLGQFALQLNKDITKVDILDRSMPEEASSDTNKRIPLLTVKNSVYKSTNLSDKAMNINDDEKSTVKEKVKKLKSLFARKGVKIIFRRKKKENASKSKSTKLK